MVFKGVSNNITLEDFKQLLDFKKITHAEAERMKSKRTGKDLPFIKIKSDDPKQVEALISGGLIFIKAHPHKDCPNRNKKTPKCANCRGPHVANYRGCPAYKDQAFRQHVVQNQICYASIVKQASPPPPTTHLISQPNKLYPW